MGITTVRVDISNPTNERRRTEVDMVVDSGAIYSVVPATVLRSIGIEPRRSEQFWLSDGRSVRRQIGNACFTLQGSEGFSKVIFGRRGDSPLLGMVTLEELGLSLDPLKRTLRPLKLMIA